MTKTLNQLTEITALADDDELLARDTSTIEDFKITKANLQETLGINKRTIYVGSVAEGISGLSITDGQSYEVASWRSGEKDGGGRFVADISVPKSKHNGVTIISPTVPAVSAQAGATAKDKRTNFRAGAGETDGSGSGCLVRLSGTAPESSGEKDQFTLTVGSGGNFESITEAIEHLSRLTPKHTDFLPTTFPEPVAVINLLAGFTMAEALAFSGDHLGWIEITSTDAVVAVDEVAAEYRTGSGLFTGYHNAILPIIGCLFEFAAGGSMFGVVLSRDSYAFVRPGSGIKNCGQNAIQLSFGSRIIAPESNFSGCGAIALRCANLCFAHVRKANLTNAASDGIAANDGSIVEANECDVSGAGQDGIRAAATSMVNAASCVSNNCGRYGVRASNVSSVTVDNATITGNTVADISIGFGGSVSAGGANFGTKEINEGVLYLGGEGSYGEGALGKYVKHLDGTMMFTKEITVNMTTGGAINGSFPETFSSPPSVWISPGNSSARAIGNELASLYGGKGLASVLSPEPFYTSQWRLIIEADAAAPTAVPVTVYAFGRYRA